MPIKKLMAVVALTAALVPFSSANDFSIEDVWVRAVPPVSKVSAGYFKLSNTGDKPLSLVSAASDIAKKVELHLSQQAASGKGMTMLQVESIDVAPHSMVELKPGSYHVMFMGLHQPLEIDDTVTIKLTFADGSTTIIEGPVASKGSKMGAKMKHDNMGHTMSNGHGGHQH